MDKILSEKKDKVFYVSDLFNKEDLENLLKNSIYDKHDHSSENESNSHHSHGDINPHIWSDPILMIEIIKGISNRLSLIDKNNSPYYKMQASTMIKNIEILNDRIINERKEYKQANVITLHASFNYFFIRYNINLVDIFEKSPGKEPSLKELTELGDKIKKNNLIAIFSEPQLNQKPADIISKEFNLKIYMLDPLGGTLSISSIVEYYEKNWAVMKNGFVK